jgi:AGCS family alanine or glycine:cation symporter
VLFAAFAAIASFGGGCMNQSNTLADQVQAQFGIPTVFSGLFFSGLVAAVIIGGIRRIGKVTAVLAPLMAMLYVAGALLILAKNVDQIIPVLRLIVAQAFSPEPLVGGAVGSIFLTMMWGIKRGLFSNEAGQGSAPIAHATAKTKEPVREGLVASLGPFIDTLVICTMTGLVIVMTGAYKDKVFQPDLDLDASEAVLVQAATDGQLLALRQDLLASGDAQFDVVDGRPVGATLYFHHSVIKDPRFTDADGRPWTGRLNVVAEDGSLDHPDGADLPTLTGEALLNGAPLTAKAFRNGLGDFGNLIVTLAVILFAVSTGISWSYYGDRATEYLFGPSFIRVYRWIFVFFFFMGSILPLKAVWTYGDVALGLMTFPNLIAVLLLTGGVVRLTKDYLSREHTPYR